MLSKKISLAVSALCVLALCCGFSLQSGATKATAKIKVKTPFMGESPVRVLGAWSNAEGLTVDAHNTADVAVEFIEIEAAGESLERLGRGGLFENQVNPDAPVFRLGPNETRLLRFPRVKNFDGGVEVRVVLMADGTGWFKGWRLKRLNKADKDGRLWNLDREANKKLLQSRSTMPVFQSFMPAKKPPQCYFPGFVVQGPCAGVCVVQDVVYVPDAQGVQVDFFTHGNCYEYPGGPLCGSTNIAREVGTALNLTESKQGW